MFEGIVLGMIGYESQGWLSTLQSHKGADARCIYGIVESYLGPSGPV